MSVPRPAIFVASVTAPRWPAGLRDDFGFLFVVLGVQDVVRDALALQKLA